MEEEREAERERPKHLPALLGKGEKLGAHWDTRPASPGDSRDVSQREQRARIPPGQAPAPTEPKAALRSVTQPWGACQEPGASSQNKSYSLSTELCHLYPEKD